MKNITYILAAASFAVGTSITYAAPINGSITFSGNAKLLDGGIDGTVIQDTNNFRNADAIEFTSVTVGGASGDFGAGDSTFTSSGVVLDPDALFFNGSSEVTFTNFAFGEADSLIGEGPVASSSPVLPFDLWSVVNSAGMAAGKGATFTITGLYVDEFENDYLSLTGVGTITADGYEATDAIWNFTTQPPGAQVIDWENYQFSYEFTFSAGAEASGVGSGDAVGTVPEPSTVALMGAAFFGLAIAGYRKRSLKS